MRTSLRVLSPAATLATLAVLAACSPAADPEPLPAAGATLHLVGWPAQTPGRLRFYRPQAMGTLLAEFPLDPAGVLTYALPAPPADSLMAFAQQPGVVVDPPDARFQLVAAITTLMGSESSETGEVRIGTNERRPPEAGDVVAQLWYVDRDVTLSGSADGCTFAQRFPAGWSYAVTKITSLAPYACEHTSSPTLPPGLAWRWIWIGP
jgi:hypothetical protein